VPAKTHAALGVSAGNRFGKTKAKVVYRPGVARCATSAICGATPLGLQVAGHCESSQALRSQGSFASTLAYNLIAMIEVDRLTRNYNTFTAVNDLSFHVEPGEVLGLVGPNGAGKTTTLRCIVGIIPPTFGDVRIDGVSILMNPIPAKRAVAFMPDEPRLFEHLTVREHLQFTARVYGVRDFEEKMQALLEELELGDQRDSLPNELSRGMKQKLVIACGLLHSPANLIFDEPLTGLDPLGIRRMKTTILNRARAGASVIVSSHLLHMVEEICDRILILKEGRKIIHGTLQEISGSLSDLRGDLNLEEIFLHVTGQTTGEGSGQ